MKVFFRRIHLYLGLGAGLVILIACATGGILVFEKELQQAFNKERYFVAPQGQRLSLNTLVETVRNQFPKQIITGVKYYNDPERSVEIGISAPQQQGARQGPRGGGRQPGFTIFINPYTSAVLEKYSYQETAFFQVFALHRWLLGGPDGIGKYIVGWSTAIFLLIILTGLVLWWPKTGRILRQRLKLRSNAGWKRLNHDLHIVLGFYSSIFLFVIAFTGLAWSFEWFNKGIYQVTSSSMQPASPPKSVAKTGASTISIDTALAVAKAYNHHAVFYNIALPKDPTDVITVSILPAQAVHEAATDALYLDRYSGAVAGTLLYNQRSSGARVRSMFKPIHTGSLWGLPSKIVAFVVCVLGVSFPVTGVIMWLNRTRKKQKKAAPVML